MTATLTGGILIGGSSVEDREKHHRATNPTTGAPIETPFAFATRADVDRACELAAKAFDEYRAIDLEGRARFLEAIAQEILNIGDVLIETAMAESGLTRPRLEGERGRTVGQLRMFAALVRDGEWLDLRIDPAQPERKPAPRVDLRLRQLPLGPVAVFGASNFPLAFSVAGGDTASALAAGCPVVVKGHPAHPATGELVGRAIQRAVESSKMPAGIFSLVLGAIEAGQQLVQNPHIKAVGFTGSRGGGLALVALAAARPEPIPVFAEMSSINPVFLLPAALAERGPAIAKAFVGSLTLGAGQFCTNPGLLFAVDGPDLNGFFDAVRANLEDHSPEPMLTPGIHSAFEQGVRAFEGHSAVAEVARGHAPNAPVRGQSRVFATDSASFLAHEDLRNEVFGAAALVVRCRDAAELPRVAEHLEGQLTATLQLAPADYDVARTLIPVLERKVGRILTNGWPTGVEVGHAMVHGGPFPATSDSRATSVGSLAIRRFLRPVSYQDLPAELIPTELANTNPLGLSRLVDGVRTKEATGQPAR